MSYPRLIIDLKKLHSNVANIRSLCEKQGIALAGVIKGFGGLIPCAREFADAGCRFIASSRIEQLERLKNAGCNTDLMMIRIPMLSEVRDIVRICEYSLESSIEVIEALNREAEKQRKIHNVILMADIGDLREGWWDRDELIAAAFHVENDLDRIHLAGVGTNLGCYGSVMPTVSKMEELVDIALAIEEKIGRRLEYVSGGATTSLERIIEKDMPEKINMLRVGEGIILSEYLIEDKKYDMDFMYRDVFRLQAEVIEVRDKPSFPVGDRNTCDAFGHRVEYIDRGIRKRAIVALGKCDYGLPEDLKCAEAGIEVLGASSDHTILDVHDASREIKVGDIIEFALTYATIVYVTASENVKIEYLQT